MPKDFKKFKVLRGFGDKRELPIYFPWELLNENNAMKFHSQTLNRLNERGGLSPEEIYCNVTSTLYHTVKFNPDKVVEWLNKQIEDYIFNV